MDYAVIMAGGTGKRLWPLSRRNRPKQVLKLFEGKTLLRNCFDRLTGIFDKENIFVLTNAAYVDTVRDDLPDVLADNVIAEPAVRDTASAIGLAATILNAKDPNATMAVVTADHIIEPAETFAQAMSDAVTFVNDNPKSLITFGIEPTFAGTQFGYIHLAQGQEQPNCKNPICPVEAFVEKPDEDTAKQYIDSGSYCWNAGMFVWKASTILDYLHTSLPDCVEPLERIKAAWSRPDRDTAMKKWFPRMPNISIDYAVMERARDVYALRLHCRWLDMGSFTALADIIGRDKDDNVVAATCHKLLDSTDNILVTEDDGHLIALIGVQNMIVAHTRDATLICPVDQTERLKELLELIDKHHGEQFL